jgi:Tfp pilus assembly protein PilN
MLIGEKHLEICIVKGNRARFLHSVEIDILDLDKGLFSFIKRLLSTIKLVLNFYQVRFMQGEEISRIVINPLDAKYNRIHLLLQEELTDIPIKLSEPLSKIYADKEKITDLDELRFPFSCLLGATLRLHDKENPLNLNLLLREKTQRRNRLTQIYIMFITSFLLLSVVTVSIGWIVLNIGILENKITQLKAKLRYSPIELNETIAIKAKGDILRKKIKEAAIITNDLGDHFLENLARAMASVTDNLWLTDIFLDAPNKNLVLTGESKIEKPIFDYISLLSNSQYFNSVELVSSKGEEQGIKFVINCTIK